MDAGHDVVVFDSLVKGHRAAVPAGATFVWGDLADRIAIERALREHDIEAVMQFAAFIEAGESMKTPARYFRNNTAHTLNLLEACLDAGVNKVVFSSTAAVYGFAGDDPIVETAPHTPVNVYGEAKLMVETMLRWFNELHGLRYAALRYFNASGGRPDRGEDHAPETHLIPLTLQVALGQRERIGHLRRRLSDAGWHLHPRLHPRGRSGDGAPAGAGGAGRTRSADLQSGERQRVLRA